MIVRRRGGVFGGGFGFHAMDGAHDGKGDRVDQRNVEWSNEQPGGDCVKCTGSEILQETRGLGLYQLAHLTDVEMDRGRSEEFLAEANTEVNHGDVERPARLIDELRDGLVELQRERGEEAEQCRRAEDREDCKGAADCKSEGDFLWSDALGELRHDGIADASLPNGAHRDGGDRSLSSGHR